MIIEICCGSVEDCVTAQQCGANRIELVCAHFLGGLTPTTGVLYRAKELVNIPIAPIVRPRMSGFFYSEEDFRAMCYDARELVRAGADGIVFGFLKQDCTLDEERTARFLDYIGDAQSCFHRAIDIVPNPLETAKKLAAIGINRILTSGGASDCLQGAQNIAALQKNYGSKIGIMAGGGIREDNVCAVVEQTGVAQIHFGGTALQIDPSTAHNSSLSFGASSCPPNECYLAVSAKRITNIISTQLPPQR